MANEAAGARRAPLSWAFPLAIAFGAGQVIAGVVFFFAYNWRDLPDMAKIALPQAAMVLAFLIFAALPKSSVIGRIAGIAATALIGVSMGVVGQVYQLGADPWRLFTTWAVLAAVIAAATRDDAQFALAFIVGSIAYFLYADQEIENFIIRSETFIPAIYGVGALAVLLARETADAAPGWLRWLMAAMILAALTIGALMDVFGFNPNRDGIFSNGFASSIALLAIGGAMLAVYRGWRPDRPVRAMALFAIAVFIGAFGLRLLFEIEPQGAGGASSLFFISALWLVAVTAALARALRRFVTDAGDPA